MLIKADGTRLFEFTETNSMDLGPVWSPDGTRIAFQRLSLDDFSKDIFVYDFEEDELFALGTGFYRIGSFSWSPEGDRLAVEGRFEDGSDYNDIWIVDLVGTNPIQLTNDPEADSGPVWAPDNSKIIFNTKRTGFDDIYVMDTDGSNQTVLISRASIIGRSAISMDSQILVYSRFVSLNDPAILSWVNIADCMEFNCQQEIISEVSDTEPAFFPGGDLLAVTRVFDTTNPEVVIITFDNEEIIRLTDDRNIDGQASFAPIDSQDSPISYP